MNHNKRTLSSHLRITYTNAMEKKKTGRPAKPEEERLIQRSIRMPPDLWAKIDAHGLEWLREVIRRARPRR